LIQYGLSNNREGIPHGEFGGILVPTNCNIEYSHIVDAMKQSLNCQKIVKLRKKSVDLKKYKVFCDLDGVLADFEQGVMDLTGTGTQSQASSKLWAKIFACPKFFENLSPTLYCKDLWNKICMISDQIPTILTGVPQGKKQYPMEKLSWCKKNLSDSIDSIITCKSTDKYKYSNLNNVLIDDNFINGIKWEHFGGIFIHHVTPERTIYELEKIFNTKEKIKVKTHETLDMEYYTPEQKVYFIDNNFSSSIDIFSLSKSSSIVAFDSEWESTTIKSLSILQLCINDIVYIIDYQNVNNNAIEQVEEIFKDKQITKICFGVDKNELKRLCLSINNVIDLQEVICDNFDFILSSICGRLSDLSSSVF
jgi:hypothetical protein